METAEVLRTSSQFDLEQLAKEVLAARQVSDFADGPYGHSISLPSEEDVCERFRDHHNNIPFADVLQDCRYLRRLFDSFLTEKAAYRLLRRVPQTAYALHDDKDKGIGICRFQIPIITNARSYLLIARENADFSRFEAEAADAAREEREQICFDLERLNGILDGQFDLYTLAPGYLYYFDTERFHTLINAGDDERIVLSLDLVVNAWLTSWMHDELTHRVMPDAVPRTADVKWQWSAFRFGLIRNA